MSGLLYVPQISSDACNAESAKLFPANVTRKADFPEPPCALIALAPWISANCTLEFLDVAKNDRAVGAVFYMPDNSTAKPPVANSTVWKLDDDETWKLNHAFPVYAIPGEPGRQLIHEVSIYSGNLSTAPHGDELSRDFDPTARARLFARIGFAQGRSLMPNLWIFLLAVLGILIVIIALSSVVMRLLQRRRRQSLQRRIQAGEVDLEMLGIKRLNVPQHILDKMPLYTYSNDGSIMAPAPPAATIAPLNINQETPSNPAESKKPTVRGFVSQWFGGNSRRSTTDTPAARIGRTEGTRSQVPPPSQETGQLTFSQCTCPICLEDYTPGETTVRELPCRHIFHPGCIDFFLLQNSSLCPVCKISVLPVGYFPEHVTNLMVRQERLARRIQEERNRQHGGSATATPGIPLTSLPSRLRTETVSSTERQEAMRQRALAMLGNNRMAEDEERERDAARPKCKSYHPPLFTVPIHQHLN
ncbi:hypothetical protein FQN49_005152 [Arthroderma sp. PD_2]|nr:hypothetical protein FQN49_005152 [Arthroderma sp. PD_2]